MIPIDKPSVTAGNSDAVDIKLENRFVSRRHFRVRFESDVFYISDLGSTNGTYLNGRKLNPNEEQILRNGDKVGLGVDEVLLVFSGPVGTVRIDTFASISDVSPHWCCLRRFSSARRSRSPCPRSS
jgi:pSer/pThr/pTyr-binding forkhead associated (FHA) protein